MAPLLASCGSILDPDTWPHAPPAPAPPSTAAPRYAAFVRGRADSIEFHASDSNGDPVDSVAFDRSAFPASNRPGFSVAPIQPLRTLLRCTLRWTAQPADTGSYRAIFTAINHQRGAPDTTLVYTIGHDPDTPPLVTCPDTLHLVAGLARTVTVSASDPDGDPIFEFWPGDPISDSPLLPINLLSWTPAVSGSSATGTLRLRANQAGTFRLSFTAINALWGFGATTLAVSPP
jgi:hypothetical protein